MIESWEMQLSFASPADEELANLLFPQLLLSLPINKDRRRKRRQHDNDNDDDNNDRVDEEDEVDEETEVENVGLYDNLNEDWQVLGHLQVCNTIQINK